jgi:hypothetical protein
MPRAMPRRFVRNILDLPQALEPEEVTAAIFDPSGVGLHNLRELVGHAASLGKRCYITSARSDRSAELVLHTADNGLAGVHLCDCEADRHALLRQITSDTRESAFPLRLLARARQRLLLLPSSLRTALVGVASSRCQAQTSVSALAQRTGGSPRSVARWLAVAGLAPPRTTLTAIRLSHLWPELCACRLSMPALASRCCYASDRALRAHCDRILRSPPSALRRHRSEEEVLDGLAKALLRPWAEKATDGSATESKEEVGRRSQRPIAW